MSEEDDITNQPVEEQQSPPADIPGDTPLDEVRDTFQSILDESTGEGRMGVKVTDDQGNVKEDVQYIRVSGYGSVEARRYEDNQGQKKYGIRRRDKLPHNAEDKLGNQP